MKFRMPNVRLLPITIGVSVLMMGVRVGDVWNVVQDGSPVQLASPSLAENASEETHVNPEEPAAKEATPAQNAAQLASLPPDSELMGDLAARRQELDRRARELDEREALMTAAEQRLDQKVGELDTMRKELEALLGQVDDARKGQLLKLVKVYESMKPKDAARIFDELEMPVLLNVLERMKEQKSAPILAAMDPSRAKEVTASLAERRQLPESVN